jgi:hypothetical protein
MLALYQRVGRRAEETVKRMLNDVSISASMHVKAETYQRVIAKPHTALAWKQLDCVTPAQWRMSRPAPFLLRFCMLAVTKALAFMASSSADVLPMT